MARDTLGHLKAQRHLSTPSRSCRPSTGESGGVFCTVSAQPAETRGTGQSPCTWWGRRGAGLAETPSHPSDPSGALMQSTGFAVAGQDFESQHPRHILDEDP